MTPSFAGKLHVVDEMCVMAFSDDLDYWGIEEVYMEVRRTIAFKNGIIELEYYRTKYGRALLI